MVVSNWPIGHPEDEEVGTTPIINDGRPIFISLAEQIADDILAGIYAPGTQVPSTNELAAFYTINPATAGKALNRLVDEGVLEKKRGLGMFVAANGVDLLRTRRRDQFATTYLTPLLEEARRLGLTSADVIELIRAQGLEGLAPAGLQKEPP